MAKRGERLREALHIRDAALVKMRAGGAFEELRGVGPALAWRGVGLSMTYRTPF